MRATLRTGELAEAAGVNRQTLRYYERRGLLPPQTRTPGGHRQYPAAAVLQLRVIKTAQRLGFTLDEITELIDLSGHHHGRRTDGLRASAGAKLGQLEAKIADLQLIAETLRAAIEAGCDDLAECAVASGCPLPFGAGK
jgi:DNA-binding transcriptional MerR regulator